MSVYKRNNKYWVAFRYNRQRYRKASPDNTYAGAKAFEALLRQRLSKGEFIDTKKEKKINISSFQDFADKWMKTYVITNNKPSEQNQKNCMINKHLKPYFGRFMLDKISSLQIEEFKAKKQAIGLSNKSINNLLGILGKCLRTAQEWEIIDKIPKMKPLKVAPKDPVYLNENDYNKLLEQAKNLGLFYEMLLFTLRTGVRIGELLALEWPDINFNDRIVTIKRNIVNGHLCSPENNKYRRIYLAQDIYDILVIKKKNQGVVFPDVNGSYQSRSSCRHRLERLCAKANVKKIGWHGLRHSFASQLATNGISLKTIQELLGHSDLKMVQRYAHLEPVTLKEAIRTLEPKVKLNLNFGHNMATISEQVKTKEVIQSSNY
jgi:integrase